MCFFAFSLDCGISLNYVSEKIFPQYKKYEKYRKSGTSEIEVDLFVQNEGSRRDIPAGRDESIHSLYILYPNKLFHLKQNSVEFDAEKAFRHQTIDFVNKYKHGTSPLHVWDVRSKIISDKITYQYYDDLIIKTIDDASLRYDIVFTTPEPNNLDIKHIPGEVDGNITVKLVKEWPGISSGMLYEILEIVDMTLLKCEFERPIAKGKTRWIRFRISPNSTSKILPKHLLKFHYETILNANNYSFEIRGPYNVRQDFLHKIESYISLLEYKFNSESYLVQKLAKGPFLEAIGRYKDLHAKLEIILSMCEDSKCKDWRLEVFSNGGVISGVREYGIYKISGSLINYVELPDKRRHVMLTWKTGKENVCPYADALMPFCDSIMGNNTKQGTKCDISSDGCYPYSGNFKIAYQWRKDSYPYQISLISLAAITLLMLPWKDILVFMYRNPVAFGFIGTLTLYLVIVFRKGIYRKWHTIGIYSFLKQMLTRRKQ